MASSARRTIAVIRSAGDQRRQSARKSFIVLHRSNVRWTPFKNVEWGSGVTRLTLNWEMSRPCGAPITVPPGARRSFATDR